MITAPFFYLAAVPAVMLMGLAKGGSGIGLLSLPLMALEISPVQVTAIMLPILIAQDVVSVWSYRRDWDARNLAILLPASAPRYPPAHLGARLSETVSQSGGGEVADRRRRPQARSC